MRALPFLVSVSLVVTAACSGKDPVNPDPVPSATEAPGCADSGVVSATVTEANHIACNADCGDGRNPPLGGNHCGQTAACRTHDGGVNRCHYIHNMEHGHVVLAYNCPQGCPDVVAKLESLAKEAKGGRALVVPDEALPGQVAAMVWSHGWSGSAVDERAIRCVLAKQDVDAPEAGLACF